MKKIKTEKWTITQNEEWWNNEEFNSKESAIKAGKDYKYGYPNEDFYVGQIYDITFEENELYDPSEYIINALSDSLYDMCEECAENWYENITKEQEKELDEMVNEAIFRWIEKNKLQPNCYTIENVELIERDYDCEDSN